MWGDCGGRGEEPPAVVILLGARGGGETTAQKYAVRAPSETGRRFEAGVCGGVQQATITASKSISRMNIQQYMGLPGRETDPPILYQHYSASESDEAILEL